MATSHHLGFSETENFTIRSAVPDHPSTELDIKSPSCAAPELCHFEFLDKMAAGRHLRFGWTGSTAIRSADPKTLPLNQTRSGSDEPLQRYGHLKFSKMAAGRHLEFGLGFACNPEMTSRDVAGCPWPQAYQIWWRYLKYWLSYGDFPFFKMAAGRHLGICYRSKMT